MRNFFRKYTRVIQKSKPEYLLKLLAAIEYTEAIFEMTADKLFGNKFKWFIILITQLSKCLVRLVLLVIHKIGIQTLPNLFDVKDFLMNVKSDSKQLKTGAVQSLDDKPMNGYVQLKHSGRVIRSIKNSPVNLDSRDWSLPLPNKPNQDEPTNTNDDLDPTKESQRYIAEILHIIRPVCHLTSVFMFNSKSWTQYFVALTIDTVSLLMMNGTQGMSESQKKEMRRRGILFIHYFIRSPMYDNYTSSLINVTLAQFEQYIPLVRYIIKPVRNYIPYWQSIYNYCWTN